MSAQIHEYTESDKEKLAELFYEFQSYIVHIDTLKRNILTPDYGRIYLQHILQKVEKHKGKIFIAEENSVMIGFVVGIIREQDDIEKISNVPTLTGEVLELYVEATSRTKGVGTMLLQKMEEYFKESHCTVVWLGVFSENEPARNFYKKHGYHDRDVFVLKPLT